MPDNLIIKCGSKRLIRAKSDSWFFFVPNTAGYGPFHYGKEKVIQNLKIQQQEKRVKMDGSFIS
jgi:hypothetical protein